MAMSVNVTFDGMAPSDALRADVMQHADKLVQFAPRALACHVAVTASARRHHQGNLYQVHARLTLPGGEITAGRTGPRNHGHEDPYVAVRDTFDVLRRQLEDYVRRQRGDVKHHEPRA